MTMPPRPAPSHVPILTEVIELRLPEATPVDLPARSPTTVVEPPAPPPEPEGPAVVTPPMTMTPAPVAGSAPAPVPAPPPSTLSSPVVAEQASVAPVVRPPIAPAGPTASAVGSAPALDEALIAQRVLADVQRQIDGMLEYRLREALAPILMRSSEALVRELRQELAKTMRDVVSRSVAQEIARQRPRG